MIEGYKASLEIANAELDAAKGGVDISRPSPQQPNSRDERTFDGTPYSQWLKMLETERKPDKLATAMEACARLAAAGDERRIARGLFVAAKLFESTDNTKERNLVWDAGTAGLKRLPGEAVVAELHDEQFRDAREFPCRFMVAIAGNTRASISETLRAAVKSHADELIATFLELARESEDRNHRLLAGASSAWLISGRKLIEFDALHSRLMQALDGLSSRNELGTAPWNECLRILVDREPEMPGLALVLVKYSDLQPQFALHRLGLLGHHAEPAVPHLLKSFLKIWKEREDRLRASAAGDERGGSVSNSSDPFGVSAAAEETSHEERLVQIVNVLGSIGPKAKAAVPLLRQIVVTAPPNPAGQQRSVNDRLFDAVKKTLTLIGDDSAVQTEAAPILLSEFSRLQGYWNLSSLTPKADHKDIQFEFDWQLSIEDKHVRGNFDVVHKVMNHIGANSNSMHYRINDTVTRRQIELIDREQRHRQLGLYELKGNRLKIELAKPGLPRPKEFSANPNKLPEGHVLLELDRDSNK